jgi:hypothetical protein
MIQGYDIIGDIHGHADELKALLKKMGYEKNDEGTYFHETRKAFFVGDLIDRGPKIKEVLEIVRPMVDQCFARAVIGNHEYNAICYHTIINGQPLRPHKGSNVVQHQKTILDFQNNESQLQDYINWFKSLPIFFEDDLLRVVHAQWKQKHIDFLKAEGIRNFSNLQTLIESAEKSSLLHKAIEEVLKGEEVHVPGALWHDKDGTPREEYRIKWWKPSNSAPASELLFHFEHNMPVILDYEVDLEQLASKPTFFGHYWLEDSMPSIQAPTICCLDYSVGKQGYLAAYRWNGERQLKQRNFEWQLRFSKE